MSHLRKEVLTQFKKLHRTGQYIFQGDDRALSLIRTQINEEFRKNKGVVDDQQIQQLLKVARDVEIELKTNVVQAVEKEPGVYQVRVTEHTPFLDNVIFNENAILPTRRSGRKCCSEQNGSPKEGC